MSVPSSAIDQEQKLAEMEAQAIKELEAENTASPEPEQKPTEGETATPDSASTPESKTTPPTQEVVEEKPEGDKPAEPAPETTPDTSEEEGQPSEKAENRYQKLANELRNANQKIELLQKQQVRTPNVPVNSPAPTKLPWDEEGAEVTPEQFEEQVSVRANKIVNQQRAVDAAVNQVSFDRIELESKYPELRLPGEGEENPEYDQDLVDFISEGYLERLKQNPTLRLKDYAGKILKIRHAAAERAQVQRKEKLQAQANSQPVLGGRQTATTTTIEDRIKGAKTLKELDQIEASLPHS